MGRRIISVALFLCIAVLLYCGDIARFVNLGFSNDARYFMFGQYGVREKDSAPYADVFLVDVRANNFLPAGVRNVVFSDHAGTLDDGKGALFTVLEELVQTTRKYSVGHLLVGRPLYVLVNNEEAKAELDFRDFQTGRRYLVSLIQSRQGSGKSVQSSFHLKVTVHTKSGSVAKHTVGLPNYMRKGVQRYRIKQIVLGPDDRALIFVIERDQVSASDGSGFDVRYMVETIALP